MKKIARRILVSALIFVMVFQCLCYGNSSHKVLAAGNEENAYTAEYVIQHWGEEPTKKEGKIFAGWYMDEEYTEVLKKKPTEYIEGQNFYAKYVNEDVFSLKLQLERVENGKYNIRLISSVDTLNYKQVGFDVTFKGQSMQVRSNSVYKNIDSVYMQEKYTYSSKVVSVDSEYMFTSIIKNVSASDINRDFHVVPCVKTYDSIISYGPSRMFSVKDGMSETTINVSLKAEKPMTSSVKVTLGTTETSAEVVGRTEDGYLHLNVSANRDELDSNTKITYGDASCMYQNLQSAKASDTSWYDATADKYILSNPADLYGLRDLVNVNELIFTGKTFYLITDLTLNEVEEGTVADWVAGRKTAPNKWTPIGYWGTKTKAGDTKIYFDGTFDGQGHAIRGLYGTTPATPVYGSGYYGFGLFSAINSNGAVKNLMIDDCYFHPTVNGIGTVTGMLYGTIDNVYVGENTYLYANKLAKGGIAGRIYAGTVTNTWFAGTIQGSAGNGYAGGFAGQVDTAIKLENCLMTGNLNLTAAGSYGNGGFIGHIFTGGSVDFENCLFAGRVTNTVSDVTRVATITGGMDSSSSVTMNNVYAMSKATNNDGNSITEESGIAGIGYRADAVKCTVNGTLSMPTDTSDLYSTFNFDYWSEYNEDGVWAAPVGDGKLPVIKAFSGLKSNQIVSGDSRTTANTSWYTSKKYEIHTVSDLYGLAKLVNEQGVSMTGVTVVLMKDIDLNPGWDASTKIAPENGRTWVPVGTTSNPFKGNFTGKMHTIKGLYMTADEGYQGLFGCVDGGKIRNLKIENSYFDFTGKATAGHEGSVIGEMKNGFLYNVISKVDIDTINGYTGGLVGQCDNASVTNCWYEGTVNVTENVASTVKTGYGALVGNAKGSTTKIVDSYANATLQIGREGNSYAAGLLGTTVGASHVLVTSSLMAGSIQFTNVSSKSSDTEVELLNVYTTAQDAEDGVTSIVNGYADELTIAGSPWTNMYNRTNQAIHPILRETDGVLKVLLIGNSFCYYHTDELYGMLAADGRDAIVANVYESGCPVADHWKWLNDGSVKYNYITVTEGGRVDHKLHSLKQCLAKEEWHVISLQQHFNPGTADSYDASANATLSYANYLYDYLKVNHSNAKLLWQQTWAYQIGYKGPSNTTSSDTSQHVLTVEKQTTNYQNIRDVAIEVCRQNNVLRVPNGDAWQIARGVVGDILCDKSGTDLAEDTKVGDNYHDGDIGGGQLLNAYGFYEAITGLDCRDNTYIPPYFDTLLINSEFNSELQTPTDVLNALKEAAHGAGAAMRQ